jgi:NAD(P)-dependent dehydrogenase (short-subunit alcohol dehydrogenase family)
MGNVLITGASRGLGLEFVRQYAHAGWRVFAGVRRVEAVGVSEGIHPLPLDVEVESQMVSAARVLQERGVQLDLLVHNAGIFAEGEEGIGTLDAEKMVRVYRVNVMAPALLTQALLPVLKSPGAKVVALTSGAALLTSRFEGPGGQYSYGATKAALNKVLRQLHFDLHPRGMVVAGIGPGFVQTDMTAGSPVRPPLTPAQSVTGMREVIEKLGPEDGGRFFNHDGGACDWFT